MREFTVDLYDYFSLVRPSGAAGKLTCHVLPETGPAMLVIPGGGYVHVSPREGEPVAAYYRRLGYHSFVLEYSVAPARFPVALREAAMAMAYIRQHAKEFGIGKVAAMGFSAGGHLCGTLGMMFDCPEVAAIAPAAMLRPDALGLCYPVTIGYAPTHEGSFQNLCGGDEALRQRLSLDRLVRPDMPPAYLWHTRDDGSVPCVGTLILAQKMVEQGIDCALHLYRSGVHGLATADSLTNGAEALRSMSSDVPNWMAEWALFLQERQFF